MLQGFKVVELATHIAAPAAAGIMADWGAEVVKIESTQGDPMRWLRAHAPGGCTPVFETNNRGKRSISLDISTPEGREIIGRLLQTADVFLTNLRPESLRRAKLDWDQLHRQNPSLVYASVTGYGLQGPEANTPAFDNAAYWSRSGMADTTRPAGQDPFSLRQGSGDHTCALATALAIVTALLSRTKSGSGRLVETSLLRTGVFVMGADFSNKLRLDEVTQTQPRSRSVNPINNFFKTSDDRWLFVMPRSSRPADWQNICLAAGVRHLADDSALGTTEGRSERRAEIIKALDEGFSSLDFTTAAARLTAADVVWSPVQSLADVIRDPQAAAAGCFVPVMTDEGEEYRAPAPPARFSDEDPSPKRGVPRLGQDTDRVLSELGYTADDVALMREQHLIR